MRLLAGARAFFRAIDAFLYAVVNGDVRIDSFGFQVEIAAFGQTWDLMYVGVLC